MGPSSSSVRLTAASTSADFDTSPASASTPAVDAGCRPAATAAPSDASRSATASPIPLAPPVTSARARRIDNR